MAANAVVRARIDEHIKEEATVVLASMGLTVSDAFRMMLTRIAKEKALPFEPLVPNAETIAAMKEARSDLEEIGGASMCSSADSINLRRLTCRYLCNLYLFRKHQLELNAQRPVTYSIWFFRVVIHMSAHIDWLSADAKNLPHAQ